MKRNEKVAIQVKVNPDNTFEADTIKVSLISNVNEISFDIERPNKSLLGTTDMSDVIAVVFKRRDISVPENILSSAYFAELGQRLRRKVFLTFRDVYAANAPLEFEFAVPGWEEVDIPVKELIVSEIKDNKYE